MILEYITRWITYIQWTIIAIPQIVYCEGYITWLQYEKICTLMDLFTKTVWTCELKEPWEEPRDTQKSSTCTFMDLFTKTVRWECVWQDSQGGWERKVKGVESRSEEEGKLRAQGGVKDGKGEEA